MIKTIDPLLSESRPQQTAVAPSVRSRIEPDDLGLRRAQVGLLYESLPTALLATVACAVTLVVAEWDVIPHVILLAWLAAMSAISAGRWGLAIAFRRSGPAAGVVPWEQAFLAGTALAGAGWGATAWALFPDEACPSDPARAG